MYSVLVEGNNFSIKIDQKNTTGGFYTSFLVDEGDWENIAYQVRELLLNRISDNINLFAKRGGNLMYYRICGVFEFIEQDETQFKNGFTFFKMNKFQILFSQIQYIKGIILSKLNLYTAAQRPVAVKYEDFI